MACKQISPTMRSNYDLSFRTTKSKPCHPSVNFWAQQCLKGTCCTSKNITFIASQPRATYKLDFDCYHHAKPEELMIYGDPNSNAGCLKE